MKILELFSGTESFSKVARARGHECFTIDIDKQFNPDLCKDILEIDVKEILMLFKPEVIWASPPCQTFSIASVSTHWDNHIPKSDKCKEAMKMIAKVLELIVLLKPKYYVIENPMGMLRKMPIYEILNKDKVTYCQYGDERMKPTDLFHNIPNFNPKCCKNGDSCHVAAPRGSKTGTQGLKGSVDRSKIPEALCLEIIKLIEKGVKSD